MGDFNDPKICWKDNRFFVTDFFCNRLFVTAGYKQSRRYQQCYNFLTQVIMKLIRGGRFTGSHTNNKELGRDMKIKDRVGCNGIH